MPFWILKTQWRKWDYWWSNFFYAQRQGSIDGVTKWNRKGLLCWFWISPWDFPQILQRVKPWNFRSDPNPSLFLFVCKAEGQLRFFSRGVFSIASSSASYAQPSGEVQLCLKQADNVICLYGAGGKGLHFPPMSQTPRPQIISGKGLSSFRDFRWFEAFGLLLPEAIY